MRRTERHSGGYFYAASRQMPKMAGTVRSEALRLVTIYGHLTGYGQRRDLPRTRSTAPQEIGAAICRWPQGHSATHLYDAGALPSKITGHTPLTLPVGQTLSGAELTKPGSLVVADSIAVPFNLVVSRLSLSTSRLDLHMQNVTCASPEFKRRSGFRIRQVSRGENNETIDILSDCVLGFECRM
jgi:hypothetical protein